MSKKLLALILAALLFSFASCGSPEDSSSEESSSESVSESVSESASEGASESEQESQSVSDEDEEIVYPDEEFGGELS